MEIGKSIIGIGIGIFIPFIGFIFYLFGDRLSFLGNLPGDLKYQSDNINLFFPITSMLIVSLFLSSIIRIIIRFFR